MMKKAIEETLLAGSVCVLLGCGQGGSTGGTAADGDTTSGASSSTQGSVTSSASTTGGETTSTVSTATSPEGSDDGPPIDCNDEELSEMYVRYVEPFVSGAVPQSCEECHMTGVDLRMWVQDTPCETMACMVDSQVVDFSDPPASPLLSMVLMGDPRSSVYDVETEHAAMLEWINWSAQCHETVCEGIESPCRAGTGAPTTGTNPIGDCSEEDLVLSFWNDVLAFKGGCDNCHTRSAYNISFGAVPCTTASDCPGALACVTGVCECAATADCPNPLPPTGGTGQVCVEGECKNSGAVGAEHAHVFEGEWDDPPYDWSNAAHRDIALRTMYNMVALQYFAPAGEHMLESNILVKPLLEGFQPTAVFGDNGVSYPNVPAGVGLGVEHGGTGKFGFGCHEEGENPPHCPLDEAPIDCRTDQPCEAPGVCAGGTECLNNHPAIPGTCPGPGCYCRVPGAVCDERYVGFVRFGEYFRACKEQ